MPAAGPPESPTTIDTWDAAFARFHLLWGRAKAGPDYNRREWADLNTFLEDRAFVLGYTRPGGPRGPLPTGPRLVKSRRK